ncbi:hypothetical protein [Micromonospora chalcea]|uniref:hypothetical protein n=1 Tax=Micromonospora chalcea TaxID=1874 RepID=UPI003F49F162
MQFCGLAKQRDFPEPQLYFLRVSEVAGKLQFSECSRVNFRQDILNISDNLIISHGKAALEATPLFEDVTLNLSAVLVN